MPVGKNFVLGAQTPWKWPPAFKVWVPKFKASHPYIGFGRLNLAYRGPILGFGCENLGFATQMAHGWGADAMTYTNSWTFECPMRINAQFHEASSLCNDFPIKLMTHDYSFLRVGYVCLVFSLMFLAKLLSFLECLGFVWHLVVVCLKL